MMLDSWFFAAMVMYLFTRLVVLEIKGLAASRPPETTC